MRIKPIGHTIEDMARFICLRNPTEIFINGNCEWRRRYTDCLVNYFDMKSFYNDTLEDIEDNFRELIAVLEDDAIITDWDERDELSHRIIYIKTEGGESDV